MTLDFPIRCCWMKCGEQKRLPAAGNKRDYLHWIGAYNWLQDTIEALCVSRKTSLNFVCFLEYLLLQRVPDRPVVLVLDNASYHHAADVQACLSLFQERVMVVWLPPYSPDLNPIERFWLFLKNEVCANCLYPSLSVLRTAVEQLFHFQNDPYSRRFSLSRDFR
jgi:transposase